jgi:hypothetical protein
MTAFLFIAANATGSRSARQVDFTRIARLFAEEDESRPQPASGQGSRFLLSTLILLGLLADTILFARSQMETKCFPLATLVQSLAERAIL